MDNNFYRDDFEQMLREKADEFKLQPGRRVWRSLYNGMHPSRKWPSVIISLLLITSLVTIGYFNTNNEDKDLAKNNLPGVTNTGIVSKQTSSANQSDITNINNASDVNSLIGKEEINSNNLSSLFTKGNTIISNEITTQKKEANIKLTGNLTITDNSVAKNNSTNVSNNSVLSPQSMNSISNPSENINGDNKEVFSTTSAMDASAETNTKHATTLPASEVLAENTKSNIAQSDKAWIDNFAFYNKSNRKKWKDRMAYEFYVTPGISYRMLKSNLKYALPVTTAQNFNTENYAINHIPSLSAEIGAAMIYSFAKNVRIKAGIQFNYTSYGIKAYETNHPILTTLTLNDLNSGYPYLESRNSSIANISSVGGTTLHNKTYQVSLPVGVDFKLAGKERLQWYAGASVQPTYIIGGRSFLLSSDKKNYIADNSMIRKWSFNTGLETFISFKTTHGTTIQIGPQVRFQIPSTYGKKYSMDEKIFSTGLKFGVVRNF